MVPGLLRARLETLALLTVSVLVAFGVTVQLFRNFSVGGNSFQQADWLVNLASGPVRRGLFGEGVLALSGFVGVDPLVFVLVLQGVLSAAVLCGLLLAFFRAGRPQRLALLMIAPLGVVYWLGDLGVVGRKELLGYLAFLPILLIDRKIAAGLAVALFMIAAIAHEANAFLAPFLIVTLALRRDMRGILVPVSVAIVLTAALGLGFAKVYGSVPDAGPICERASGRYTAADFCAGIIDWMGSPVSRNAGEVRLMLEDVTLPGLLASVALAILPFIILCWPSPRRTLLLLGCLFGFVVLAPLYVVATDWGRWLAMSTMGLTFVALSAAIWRRELAEFLYVPARRILLLAVACLSVTLAPWHFSGRIKTGALWSLWYQSTFVLDALGGGRS